MSSFLKIDILLLYNALVQKTIKKNRVAMKHLCKSKKKTGKFLPRRLTAGEIVTKPLSICYKKGDRKAIINKMVTYLKYHTVKSVKTISKSHSEVSKRMYDL